MSGVVRKEKLTKALIDSLFAEQKEYFVWDTEITGFAIRVLASGRKSFILKYRNQRGISKQYTIGKYGPLTVDAARKVAKGFWADIARGSDPVSAKKAAKSFDTVGQLCDRYYTEAIAGRVLKRGKAKKLSTLKIDYGRIERHIKPLIGSIPVDELNRQQVQKFMQDVILGKTAKKVKTEKKGGVARVTGGPGTASKAVSLLSAIFNWAIQQGLTSVNPCVGVEKPADKKKQRFLTRAEFKKLGAAINEISDSEINPTALNAIKLYAYTGFRRDEILSLKWSEIDFENNCVRFEDTKTGAQIRPLGYKAIQLLESISKNSDEWIFPAYRGEGHWVNIRKSVLTLLSFASLPNDITPHVFRHSFASVANELGFSELTIAAMIGHSSNSITARYVHHVDDVLIKSVTTVSNEIHHRMFGEVAADNVVDIQQGVLWEKTR